jgi:hypothetical protein
MVPMWLPVVVQWHSVIEYHPVLGWKAKRNFEGCCLEERDDVFRIQVGPDGWPGRLPLADSRTVVIGDSFAFGYGTDSDDTYFNVRPELLIKPLGAPGYNMAQEVLLLQEVAPALNGKTVIWFVYYGNDLYDNMSPEMTGYRCPFVAQDTKGNWDIVTRHISPEKWASSLGRQGKRRLHIDQNIFTRSYLSERAFSACEYLIGKGRAICRRAGAHLIVMTIPFPQMVESETVVQGRTIDPQYADDMLRGICQKWDIPMVALKDMLNRSDYKISDEHWNDRGHRKVADIIARTCQQASFTPL